MLIPKRETNVNINTCMSVVNCKYRLTVAVVGETQKKVYTSFYLKRTQHC